MAPAHHPVHASHAHDDGHHSPADMIRDAREKWLWTNYAVIAMGAWLMTSPFTFGYASRAMTISDVASGALLIVCAGIALWPRPRADFWGRWTACFVGVWLQLAPLVFWAPTPVAFATDTLIGAWVIALTILVPMMPGMAHHMAMMKPGPEVPPGWTYNPSSWHQRAPIILCGFAGWFISRYLAAVQLGYIDTPWEPFFGRDTLRVLHSDVSRAWPVSDAGLGALAYTIEALMAFMGGKERWRTMPWMVSFFGIIVIPLGVTHVVLVILQPVMVGAWCTLCLAAAMVMLIMIPLTVDEIVAMLQFMADARRKGKPLWRTFWVGDTMEGGGPDQRTPPYGSTLAGVLPPMAWGVTLPWTLIATMALGIWLVAAPAVLGGGAAAADSDRLVGALILTDAAIATAEVTRAWRFVNIPAGLWLMIAPWLLAGSTPTATWNDVIVGVAVIFLALSRGRIREHYAAWNRYIV